MATPSSSTTSSLSNRGSPPEAYQSIDRPRMTKLDTYKSFGYAVLLPCLPIARFTGRSRLGFLVVFAAVFLLYAGGLVCFIMASRGAEPALVTDAGSQLHLAVVFVLAWITYIGGPWATLAVDFHFWYLWWYYDDLGAGPATEYDVSSTAVYLLLVHFAIQLLLTIVVSILIFKLQVRKTRSFGANCCLCCSSCCCPNCALGGAIKTAKRAQAEGVDEIPAYHV